nr:glycoside hydrolase family 3 N-terminal domain-containing protein [Tessaracoccus sp. MC1679]
MASTPPDPASSAPAVPARPASAPSAESSVTRPALEALVDATLAGLSDDECVALLHQVNPAMPHHGLAEFHTGAEALHGVAWTGTATVFPQPVGMAATWDAELLRELGEATSTEVRAKHAADPVGMSLNVWAPVVNPLRHPLWGRNEEGYSEDPHVTAECAIAYSSGLRGDHDVFWRTVPTFKHLLAYNNELDRCTSSSNLPPRVLHEYDLPPFVQPIEAGVVGGVMAAHNLVNGRPAHTSQELFESVRAANPDLLAVSDAYAPTNLTGAERAYATDAEAHAAAILAGLDSFTDRDADSSHTLGAIRAALGAGLLGMEDVRRAARRVLLTRALTGELTPEADPYAHITADEIDTPLEAARTVDLGRLVERLVDARDRGEVHDGPPPHGLPDAPGRHGQPDVLVRVQELGGHRDQSGVQHQRVDKARCGEHGERDHVDQHPRDEVGQGSQGLDGVPEPWGADFVEEHSERERKHRRRDADEAHAQRVRHHLPDLGQLRRRSDQEPEPLQADELAAGKPEGGLVVVERVDPPVEGEVGEEEDEDEERQDAEEHRLRGAPPRRLHLDGGVASTEPTLGGGDNLRLRGLYRRRDRHQPRPCGFAGAWAPAPSWSPGVGAGSLFIMTLPPLAKRFDD